MLFWAVLGLGLAAVLVVLVVLMEVGFSRVTSRPADYLVRHPRLHHIWRPNGKQVHTEWIDKNPDYPEPYTHYYNAQGWLEDYDVAKRKPDGTYRIFYVGDSFTEGTVPMNRSIPSRVESYLNSLPLPYDLRFEVINTGTSSYSPLLYYILIRYYVIDFAPDLIVVNVDMTDVFDDTKYRATLTLDEGGDPWAVTPSDPWGAKMLDVGVGLVEPSPYERLRRYLHEKSYTYNFLLEYKRHRSSGASPTSGVARRVYSARWGWVQKQWDDRTADDVQASMETLKALADFCRLRGIELLLTGVPHYRQFPKAVGGESEWVTRPHREIQKVADETGAEFFDSHAFLSPLITGTDQAAFYYRDNMHFNPRGYDAWARAHIEALMDRARGLLPKEAYPSGD